MRGPSRHPHRAAPYRATSPPFATIKQPFRQLGHFEPPFFACPAHCPASRNVQTYRKEGAGDPVCALVANVAKVLLLTASAHPARRAQPHGQELEPQNAWALSDIPPFVGLARGRLNAGSLNAGTIDARHHVIGRQSCCKTDHQMPLDEHDFECVASLVDSYFNVAIADRNAEIEKLTAQVATLQTHHETPVSHVSHFPGLSGLCDPYGKLPQTRERRRQQTVYDAHRMRGYIGEGAFARIIRGTGADRREDHTPH